MMRDVTKNEMFVILKIFKTPDREFNANNLSKEIDLTPMGVLKILKRLEQDGVVVSKAAGKAVFYRLNFSNDYLKDYLKFVLRREAECSSAYIKRWVREVKKLKNADIAILFGSVIKKEKGANDIDVLLVTNQSRFERLKKEVRELNKINEKNIHPVYQSSKDLQNSILKQDKVILDALKGIVVFGEEKLIELVK